MLVVIVISALIYYRTSVMALVSSFANPATNEQSLATRELVQMASYQTPQGTDNVRFTVTLDTAGLITDIKVLNVEDPGNKHVEEFNQLLLQKIQGKKLADLNAIDKVGTSTLSTDAFNTALEGFKMQLK